MNGPRRAETPTDLGSAVTGADAAPGATPPPVSKADPRPDTLPRVALGDRSAVAECIDRHGALVWALARRFCPNASDAEDLVQDVFIALWKNAPRFDPSLASEATFVAMITRRRLIDGRRRLRARPEPGPLPDEVASAALDAAPRAELADEARRAAEALGELPDDQRRVLTLATRDGLTYDQIARATGRPLGTVKTLARRGLIRLRQRLDAGRGDSP